MLSGSVETVQVLLQNGAPPDVRDSMDLTPLLYAALGGNLSIVKVSPPIVSLCVLPPFHLTITRITYTGCAGRSCWRLELIRECERGPPSARFTWPRKRDSHRYPYQHKKTFIPCQLARLPHYINCDKWSCDNMRSRSSGPSWTLALRSTNPITSCLPLFTSPASR